jgi:hypothetical protein
MFNFDLEAFEPIPIAESSCQEYYDIHSFEPTPIADQQDNVVPPRPAKSSILSSAGQKSDYMQLPWLGNTMDNVFPPRPAKSSILSSAGPKSDSVQLPWLGNTNMSLKCMFESADIQVNTGAISSFTEKRHCTNEANEQNTTALGANTEEDPPPSGIYCMNQSGRWKQRFQELCAFQKEYGHCCVPSDWPQNQSLAQWVKRQRYQYKKKKEGQHSNMITEREQALGELGFVWDSHAVFWEERLGELHAFREKHGHCNVPTRYPENLQLAVWAKCQRRQFKLFTQGRSPSNMNLERISKLMSVGFVFDPRNVKRPKTAKSA